MKIVAAEESTGPGPLGAILRSLGVVDEATFEPAVYNFKVRGGDTFRRMCRLRAADGSYVDMTGWEAFASILHDSGMFTPIEVVILPNQDTDPDARGRFRLHIDEALTQGMPGGGPWDCRFRFAGDVQTLLEGEVTHKPGITVVPA